MASPVDISSYERLESRSIDYHVLIEWHFTSIINSASKRISFRQSYKNPWTVSVDEKIQRQVFIECFKAIRDFSIEYGRDIHVKRDKNCIGQEYTLKFWHHGALVFHLSKLSKLSKDHITNLFKKSHKTKGTASVVVSEQKPSILKYNCKKSLLTLTISYEVENKYGIKVSF